MISIITPCYNEMETIEIFVEELKKVFSDYKLPEYEVIFIDDGSKDNTLKILKKIVKENQNIKFQSFSKNFGKEAAILAGLKVAQGEFVALMDVDLQDPPEMLVEMHKILISEDTVDCVATKRINRDGEPKIKSYFSNLFYTIINKISNIYIEPGARDYRLMRRNMVDSILQITEYNRFSKGLFAWIGYNTKFLDYENKERSAGTTKWSFIKLLKYSIDGFLGFTTTPLTLVAITGSIIFGLTIIFALVILFRKIFFGGSIEGWTSIILLISFFGSIQILSIGIIGQYLAKTYLEVKKRPHYFVREEYGIKDE